MSLEINEAGLLVTWLSLGMKTGFLSKLKFEEINCKYLHNKIMNKCSILLKDSFKIHRFP